MAASMAWRNRLKNHSIFANLAINKAKIAKNTESRNLTVIKDGEIYVWDSLKTCVLTTNLKNLVRKNDSENESRLPYQVESIETFLDLF